MAKHAKFISKLASKNAATFQQNEKLNQNLEIPETLKEKAFDPERAEDRKVI